MYQIIQQTLTLFFFLLLPTQLGKHFFFGFSYLSGIRVDYLAPALYVTDLVVIASILFNVGPIIRKAPSRKTFLFLFLLLVNLVLSLSKIITLYQSIRVIELAVIITLISIWKREKWFLKVATMGFLVGAMGELFLSIFQLANRASLQGIFYWLGERYFTIATPGIAKASIQGVEFVRPYGTFSHPNSMGGFYLLLYALALTMPFFNRWRYLQSVLLTASSILVFVSFSKVAILTYLIVNLLFYIKKKEIGRCRWCVLSRIVILVMISLVFLSAKSDPKTLEKRVSLVTISFSIMKEYPLTGTGIGSYLLAQDRYAQQFPDSLNQPVHNIFLLAVTQLGIPITLLMLVAFRPEILRFLKKAPFVTLVIVLTGFFDHYWLTLIQNMLLLSVVVGTVSFTRGRSLSQPLD